MRVRLCLPFLCLALLASSSPAEAAADVRIEDADVYPLNERDCPVLRVGAGKTVDLVARLENTGTDPYNANAVLVFNLTGTDVEPSTLRKDFQPLRLANGSSMETFVSWSPAERGTYELEISLEGDRDAGFTITDIIVTKTEVLKCSLAEFAVRYSWFYGGFLSSLFLFAAVIRLRRPRL